MVEVPEEWDCQAVSVGEDCLQSGLYGFILKPKESTEGQIELTCQDRFAVCGTGLSEEKITLAGKTATMGTFDNHSHWDFIVFGDDSPEIVAESYDCDTWNTKQWKDVLNLIDTLRFDPAQAEGGIGQFIQESEDDEIGVIMEIEQVSSKGATVCFRQYDQNTNEELTYGQDFSLEKKKGEKWEKLPTVIREYGFEDIGYTIPFGDKSVWKTDWTWLYGELSPGTYRMKKEVLEGTGNNRKTHELYAQFMIASQEK